MRQSPVTLVGISYGFLLENPHFELEMLHLHENGKFFPLPCGFRGEVIPPMFSSCLTMYTPQAMQKRKKSDHAGVEKDRDKKDPYPKMML